MTILEETILSSEALFSGRVIGLRVDTVDLGDGTQSTREMVVHPGAVAMVPLTQDDHVWLVRQYRPGAKQVLLEIPAGGLELGEERLPAAQRELQEEIGWSAEELIHLGEYYVAASYNTERITIYLARGLRESRLAGDFDERLEAERVPFRQAVQQALSGGFTDGKTAVGLLWAAHHLGLLKIDG